MESNANGIIYNHKEKRLILSNVDELCCGERNITIGDLLRCLKRYPKDTIVAIRIEQWFIYFGCISATIDDNQEVKV